jgi:hypothetical protein
MIYLGLSRAPAPLSKPDESLSRSGLVEDADNLAASQGLTRVRRLTRSGGVGGVRPSGDDGGRGR